MKKNVLLASAMAMVISAGFSLAAKAQGYGPPPPPPMGQQGYPPPGSYGPPRGGWHDRRDYGFTLRPGQSLMRGESLLSNNGWYRLTFQEDGNVVLTRVRDNRPLWATGTNGRPAFRFTMQDDGNAVLYTRDNRPLWSSGVTGPQMRHGQVLILQDDGNLVVYSRGRVYWASNTRQRR